MGGELRRLEALFDVDGTFVAAEPLGSGHIHDSFVATYRDGATERRYVHQRLNTSVFRDPRAVCENVARVTEHLRARLSARGVPDLERRCLRLVRTRRGETCAFDAGEAWRTLDFVEGTHSRDVMRDADQARRTARAFAAFVADLTDLPSDAVAVTIPRFHDLDWRAEELLARRNEDAHGRLAGAADDVALADELLDRLRPELRAQGVADLPRRVVHNDCKLNNLLLDSETGEGLCVIDLDTVMEGTVANDFGELARTGSCTAAEDERDLARVVFDRDLFAGLAEGYLAGAAEFLTDAERRALPLAGPMLALENGLRFLADHLAGDRYFRIHRPGHNLDRARTQLALAASMLEGLADARSIVADL